MNTNQKGAIGLTKTILILQEKGFLSYLPFEDYSPVDIITLDPKTGKTYRLQVKYRSGNDTKISIKASSVVNGQRISIDPTLIDGWAIYWKEYDKVFFRSIETLGNMRSISVNIFENESYGWMTEW